MKSANSVPSVNDNIPFVFPDEIFRAAFEHSRDGQVIIDGNYHILYINQASLQLMGFDDAREIPSDALLEHCSDAYKLLNAGQETNSTTIGHKSLTNVEMTVLHKSGQEIPVLATLSRIPLHNGEAYFLMSFRDMRDRERIQQERKQREELHYTMQERERLARDLHDGVVQDIAYANMQLKALADEAEMNQTIPATELKQLSLVLEKSFVELRQAIYDLTFPLKDGLVTYTKNFLSEFTNRTGIQVRFDSQSFPATIDPFIAFQLGKILQEALANIRKHAEATFVDVSLLYFEKRKSVLLSISDNGCGFEPDAVQGSQHFGLKTMRERSLLLNAEFSIVSSVGQGTKVQVHVPIDK